MATDRRGCQARITTCRPNEWKLCTTYSGPFLSFFPDFRFCFADKQEFYAILPTIETKEGAKYLELLAFQYMRERKKIWKLKRMIQKRYGYIRQEAI